MTTPSPTHLRSLAADLRPLGLGQCAATIEAAADEIERLRAALDRSNTAAIKFATDAPKIEAEWNRLYASVDATWGRIYEAQVAERAQVDAENGRLRAMIKDAPHGDNCSGIGVLSSDQEASDRMCTCWKSGVDR